MPILNETRRFSNISATTAAFQLSGGQYIITRTATWGGGSLQLQLLGPDGSTYLGVHTALTANGIANVYLPAGTYKFNVATATAVYAEVTRINPV